MDYNKQSKNKLGKRIVLKDLPDDVKKFLNMPHGVEKNIIYFDKIIGSLFPVVDIIKTDEGFYYSELQLLIKKSTHSYYVIKKNKVGFTLKNGKVFFWGSAKGASLQPNIFSYLDLLFNEIKCDWFDWDNQSILTKGVLERIISGKITNNFNVAKFYLRSIKMSKVSPKLFLRCLKKSQKQHLYKLMVVSKNPIHALEFIDKYEKTNSRGNANAFYGTLADLMHQAEILERKIDFRWSQKRIENEHTKWTKEIMKAKLKLLSNIKIKHPKEVSKLVIPKQFKLLKTTMDIFKEGEEMDHCLYTNYKNKIEEGKFIIFHVEYNKNHATLSFEYRPPNLGNLGQFKYHSCVSTRNKTPVPEIIDVVNNFITKNEELIVQPTAKPSEHNQNVVFDVDNNGHAVPNNYELRDMVTEDQLWI